VRLPPLHFSPVGGTGDYPAWVRELRGHSGAYVIAVTQPGAASVVAYVGESHTSNLYETMTRHFQRWARAKKFWAGYSGRTDAPGVWYQRRRCLAAAVTTTPEEAIVLQDALIRVLSPRDNIIGQVTTDETVPF
jgi:hypothetical protein